MNTLNSFYKRRLLTHNFNFLASLVSLGALTTFLNYNNFATSALKIPTFDLTPLADLAEDLSDAQTTTSDFSAFKTDTMNSIESRNMDFINSREKAILFPFLVKLSQTPQFRALFNTEQLYKDIIDSILDKNLKAYITAFLKDSKLSSISNLNLFKEKSVAAVVSYIEALESARTNFDLSLLDELNKPIYFEQGLDVLFKFDSSSDSVETRFPNVFALLQRDISYYNLGDFDKSAYDSRSLTSMQQDCQTYINTMDRLYKSLYDSNEFNTSILSQIMADYMNGFLSNFAEFISPGGAPGTVSDLLPQFTLNPTSFNNFHVKCKNLCNHILNADPDNFPAHSRNLQLLTGFFKTYEFFMKSIVSIASTLLTPMRDLHPSQFTFASPASDFVKHFSSRTGGSSTSFNRTLLDASIFSYLLYYNPDAFLPKDGKLDDIFARSFKEQIDSSCLKAFGTHVLKTPVAGGGGMAAALRNHDTYHSIMKLLSTYINDTSTLKVDGGNIDYAPAAGAGSAVGKNPLNRENTLVETIANGTTLKYGFEKAIYGLAWPLVTAKNGFDVDFAQFNNKYADLMKMLECLTTPDNYTTAGMVVSFDPGLLTMLKNTQVRDFIKALTEAYLTHFAVSNDSTSASALTAMKHVSKVIETGLKNPAVLAFLFYKPSTAVKNNLIKLDRTNTTNVLKNIPTVPAAVAIQGTNVDLASKSARQISETEVTCRFNTSQALSSDKLKVGNILTNFLDGLDFLRTSALDAFKKLDTRDYFLKSGSFFTETYLDGLAPGVIARPNVLTGLARAYNNFFFDTDSKQTELDDIYQSLLFKNDADHDSLYTAGLELYNGDKDNFLKGLAKFFPRYTTTFTVGSHFLPNPAAISAGSVFGGAKDYFMGHLYGREFYNPALGWLTDKGKFYSNASSSLEFFDHFISAAAGFATKKVPISFSNNALPAANVFFDILNQKNAHPSSTALNLDDLKAIYDDNSLLRVPYSFFNSTTTSYDFGVASVKDIMNLNAGSFLKDRNIDSLAGIKALFNKTDEKFLENMSKTFSDNLNSYKALNNLKSTQKSSRLAKKVESAVKNSKMRAALKQTSDQLNSLVDQHEALKSQYADYVSQTGQHIKQLKDRVNSLLVQKARSEQGNLFGSYFNVPEKTALAVPTDQNLFVDEFDRLFGSSGPVEGSSNSSSGDEFDRLFGSSDPVEGSSNSSSGDEFDRLFGSSDPVEGSSNSSSGDEFDRLFGSSDSNFYSGYKTGINANPYNLSSPTNNFVKFNNVLPSNFYPSALYTL